MYKLVTVELEKVHKMGSVLFLPGSKARVILGIANSWEKHGIAKIVEGKPKPKRRSRKKADDDKNTSESSVESSQADSTGSTTDYS